MNKERNISGKQAREFTAEMNGRACYSMPEACPFCKQTAEFRSDERGDIDMDCLNCLIEVTLTRPAAATECRSPERTLEYIRGLMQISISRPVVTSIDMQR